MNNALTVQSSAISTTEHGVIAFRSSQDYLDFAQIMAASGVALPKHLRGNPGTCLAVCIQASEWRMSPFSVANKSYSVNDRLAYEAQLIAAVILQRAPIVGRLQYEFIGAGGTRQCKVTATLRDGEGTVDYTTPQVQAIAVKNSPLWKSDPDQQLSYFAARSLCRRHFPDVLLGVYTDDEIQDAPPLRNAPASARERLASLRNPQPATTGDEPQASAEASAPVIEAESLPSDDLPEDNSLVLDFIAQVNDAVDVDELTRYVGELEAFEGTQKDFLRKTIFKRSQVLGFVWDAQGKQFVTGGQR
jgi:hypothetical protein